MQLGDFGVRVAVAVVIDGVNDAVVEGITCLVKEGDGGRIGKVGVESVARIESNSKIWTTTCVGRLSWSLTADLPEFVSLIEQPVKKRINRRKLIR